VPRDPRQLRLFEDDEPSRARPKRRSNSASPRQNARKNAGFPARRSRPAAAPRAKKPAASAAFAAPSRCQVPAGLVLRLASRRPDLKRFVAALERHLPARLDQVTLTDNRSRFLSARPAGRKPPLGRAPLALRLHWGFALAPEKVLAEVGAFLGQRGDRQRNALAALRSYFDRFQPPAGRGRRRGLVLQPRGEHHDLAALRDEINRRYFGGRLEVPITWGRELGRRRLSSIHLGTYDFERKVIRIHRRLDHPRVPRLVVASVVHHEMLHAAMPATTVGGRRRLHPPEFRRREQAFSRHREAQAWIHSHLRWLLRG